ncbi:Nif3-like dinuclear metal center hexameric protein [Pseudactinotalea sp. HY160]|uniref:Nif3-like dinuclear metal center hexameric protein n=1 Tax=Pseudactinotalea sp. HY160 TaxID=2654490 RepID=UPI00128B2024|nr:Nif3-like dinuclear metal center hexameric protein [Pseudactinotalea sp. HY160]MPV50008.1 Nif3-like dinuclear metal center hexameric protein [Pseudactinotalea sp. HY160]
MVTVADIVAHLRERYPESTAQGWDAVGLTVGDPAAAVRRVLVAVDIDPTVVAEALEWGADLLLTHHPLFLSGTTTVAATTPKGRMVHDLIGAGVALYTAHTNADIAPGGVNDSLAELLGLADTVPLEVLEPVEHPDAHPGSGIGRVGTLAEPLSLRGFGELVAGRLPATEHGVRIHGDLDRSISRVAVCGGSGDSYLDAARRAGVDAYLTADLRHHRAAEAGAMPGAPALVDVAHYASEWPWVPRVADRLAAAFDVDVRASRLVTDPWTVRLASTNLGGSR